MRNGFFRRYFAAVSLLSYQRAESCVRFFTQVLTPLGYPQKIKKAESMFTIGLQAGGLKEECLIKYIIVVMALMILLQDS